MDKTSTRSIQQFKRNILDLVTMNIDQIQTQETIKIWNNQSMPGTWCKYKKMDTSIKIVVNPRKCQLCMSEELLIQCINFITTIKMLIQQIDENEIDVTGSHNGTK